MTRVDELQEKYPGLHREIIVKWEALGKGIRDSDALDKTSHWVRGAFSCQTYDHDKSLKDGLGKKPDSVKAGHFKAPGAYFMKSGIGAAIQRDSASPYEIREIGDGQFALFEGEDKVEDIYFRRASDLWPEDGEPLTGKGTPVTSLVTQSSPTCFAVNPVRYCEYFTNGEECKFCNYNATQQDARFLLGRPITINLEDTLEAYNIISSTVRLVEGRIQNGGIRNSEHEAQVHLDFVGKIANAASYTPNIVVYTQPMERKNILRLKDAGAACVGFNMEVWDPKLFGEVNPGKVKHIGYERYKEAFLEAVEVFGAGNVSTNFVAGVTLMAKNGHRTWQESRDSLIEGCCWMIKNGVLPSFMNLRLGPGSVYGADVANRQKMPPAEYYLDAAIAHHEAMLEYGLYPRMNKLGYCPMDCLSNLYGGEIGILEQAGDVGKWLADMIPAKANWMARLIESANRPDKS